MIKNYKEADPIELVNECSWADVKMLGWATVVHYMDEEICERLHNRSLYEEKLQNRFGFLQEYLKCHYNKWQAAFRLP